MFTPIAKSRYETDEKLHEIKSLGYEKGLRDLFFFSPNPYQIFYVLRAAMTHHLFF